MSKINSPKINFPCSRYPIKIIGNKIDGFVEKIIVVLDRLSVSFYEESIVVKDSNGGRFCSLRLEIEAKSLDQLKLINQELRKTGFIQMVL